MSELMDAVDQLVDAVLGWEKARRETSLVPITDLRRFSKAEAALARIARKIRNGIDAHARVTVHVDPLG